MLGDNIINDVEWQEVKLNILFRVFLKIMKTFCVPLVFSLNLSV